jgi:hypothetical protein
MVAAGIAQLYDFAHTMGYSSFNQPGIMHANLLLMGDGVRGSDDPGGRNQSSAYNGLDHTWGAGRFRLRFFTEAGMDGPWAWNTGWNDLTHGQSVDFPIGTGPVSSDVDYLRAVMSWDEPHLNATAAPSAAYIQLRVVTTAPVGGVCVNPGGIGGIVHRSDLSFDTDKMITLQGVGLNAVRTQCAWLRMTGTSVTPGATGVSTRRVFRASYYEDRDREPAENLNQID